MLEFAAFGVFKIFRLNVIIDKFGFRSTVLFLFFVCLLCVSFLCFLCPALFWIFGIFLLASLAHVLSFDYASLLFV